MPSIYDAVGASKIVETLVAAVLITLFLAVLVRRELSVAAAGGSALIPPGRLTPRNFVEILLEGIAGLAEQTIGHNWAKYLPLIGTLGLFILISNLMGLVPGFGGPTEFVETNLSWAILSFLVAEYVAFREQGPARYIAHLIGPAWWLAPIMLPVEIISHLSRILSLTIRLTANVFADHTLVGVFLSFFGIQWFVPWVFMGLGVFVAFLQAFIFTFLTIIYIGQAMDHGDHH